VWKPIFYGATVLEAGAIGFTIYEWQKGNSEGNKVKSPTKRYSDKDCGGAGPTEAEFKQPFKAACDAYKLQKIGWAATSVVGVAVIGSFIMAFVRDSGSSATEPKTASGGHRKRRELAITPIVSPDGGGATLRFDW